MIIIYLALAAIVAGCAAFMYHETKLAKSVFDLKDRILDKPMKKNER